MAHRSNDRPSYPEILNFYYRGNFPSILGGQANSVAHAIIFKSNSLYFPDSFRMANAELCRLSGVEFNIGR
ncbi:hypothetical protein KAR91_62105, partial [Candidatus Pacearchaeota archaeon]|nr:hypothetical protein [Candidatus Pacearchaeota archaeon]